MNFRSSRICDFYLGNCAPTHPCLGEISQKNNMRNATTINVGAGNWNRTCRRGSSSLTWLSHLLVFCTLFPQTWTSRHGRYKRETGKPDTSHLLGDDVAGGTFLIHEKAKRLNVYLHMAFIGGDLLAGPLGCGTHYRGGSCKVGFMTSGFAS